MKPAIIFDLDGTLIDSAPAIHAVTNRVLAERDETLLSLEQVRGFIGRGVGHLVACVMRNAGQVPEGAAYEAMKARFNEIYTTEVEGNHQYPYVRPALDAIVEAGHPVAICTNKPYLAAMAALEHVGLLDIFDKVVGGDTLPRAKPDPAMLHHAHDLCGGDGLIYVGDSEVDAQTASAAGCPFVLFTEGYCHVPVHDLAHDVGFSDWRMFPGIIEHMIRG